MRRTSPSRWRAHGDKASKAVAPDVDAMTSPVTADRQAISGIHAYMSAPVSPAPNQDRAGLERGWTTPMGEVDRAV